jgi:hypothetical protein
MLSSLTGCQSKGHAPGPISDQITLRDGQKVRCENLGTGRIEVTEGWATVFRAEVLLRHDRHLSSKNRRLAMAAVSTEVSVENLGILVAVKDQDFLRRTVAACNSRLDGLQIFEVRFPELALEESVPVRP